MSKNKQKLTILSLLVLSLFLLNIGFVLSADGTDLVIVTPTSGATVTGQNVFNCSYNATTASENYTMARIYLVSASKTANTTEALASGWTLNASDTSTSGTFNTSKFEDGSDYTIKCQIWNGTAYANKTGTVIIDNTVPTAPTSLQPSTDLLITTASTTLSLSATVTNSKTTSCTYVISKGDTNSGDDYITGDGTYSGTNCSFSKTFASNQNDNGNWYWSIIASDGKDTATSTKNIVSVNVAPVGGSICVSSGGTLDNNGNCVCQSGRSVNSDGMCVLTECLSNPSLPQCSTNTLVGTQPDYTLFWVVGFIVTIVVFVIISKRIR